MEKRKDSLSALKLCRFCLVQDESLTTLYDRSRTTKNALSFPLSLKILSCLSVEVFPSDKMPSFICNRCKFFMELFFEYKQICRQADEATLQYIQNGTSLVSVPWPAHLSKIFPNSSNKLSSKQVVKTVVEGGTTVQVTSHDISDSDEDDENVYNIKIDGPDESKDLSATIKVVTSDKIEPQDKGKSQADKEFSSVSKLTRHVRSHVPNARAYPCKYCNKSFLKSHHYTRHLRVKHREAVRACRGAFGQPERYRCEQCEDTFETQDELIYHSAIHATQNLTCPLCQEKFENVDAVTTHIKSHVNGVEFMCDLCELVFTSKDKLDAHVAVAHDEEFDNSHADESSMEMDMEGEDEDDDDINVKEEDDHMVVEIKKTDDFIISKNEAETEEKVNTNSEESETETTYTELATVDTLALVKAPKPEPVVEKATPKPAAKPVRAEKSGDSNQTASILRKAEEIKRKAQQKAAEPPKEKEKPSNKGDSSNSAGASDKSLRLLEKELQELQRTNTRNEAAKSATKTVESLRNRRPQVHTSTPKTRAVEEKRTQMMMKSPAVEKKLPERRVVTKENKEPKETKEVKTNNTSAKEDKEAKEKETPKNVVKNGGAAAADKSTADESIRRSTRPSKIKDYAKMIRDKTQESEEEDSDIDDEEYDVEESRSKARRSVVKPAPKLAASPAPTPTRKRGRPRKEPLKEVPNKMKKDKPAENEDAKSDKGEENEENKAKPAETPKVALKAEESTKQTPENNVDTYKPDSDAEPKPASGILVSPTGQTLKKVPIRSLPPGVKPLPLPMNARTVGPGELCEMQIGKKVVKVQKIVMTKAEVEAMAKKGLVEMKDGNMVLKQGIKLPTSDPMAIKSSLVGDKDILKESPAKKDKAPTHEKETG